MLCCTVSEYIELDDIGENVSSTSNTDQVRASTPVQVSTAASIVTTTTTDQSQPSTTTQPDHSEASCRADQSDADQSAWREQEVTSKPISEQSGPDYRDDVSVISNQSGLTNFSLLCLLL